MTQKNKSRSSWRKRLLIGGIALFSLYLCFGIWAVPAILISQVETRGSQALGRELTVARASFNPLSFETKLFDLVIGADGGGSGELLKVGKVSANPQLSSVFGTIRVKSIEVSDGDLWVERREGGVFSFQDILDSQAPAPEELEPAELVSAIVEHLLLRDLTLHFRDSSLETPFEETVAIEIFKGRDLGTVRKAGIVPSETNETDFHWDFDGTISTGSGSRLLVSGGATSIEPWGFVVTTELVDFALGSLQPYVDESVVAQVEGVFGFKFSERISFASAEPRVFAKGDISLSGLSVSDNEQTFASVETLRVDGIEADLGKMEIVVGQLSMGSPKLSGILLEDGSPRLPAFKEAAASSEIETSSESSDFKARIDSVAISDGSLTFEDRSLASPFNSTIDRIELSLSDLHAARSGSEVDASGLVRLALRVLGGELQLTGELASLKGMKSAQLKLAGLQLAELQPYVSEYANAVLKDGRISLDVEASVEGGEAPSLSGNFKLEALEAVESVSGREIVSLSSFSLNDFSLKDDVLAIESVELVEPLLTTWQDEVGINLGRIAKMEQEAAARTEAIEQKSGTKLKIGRFEMKSAGVDFMDTTLASTYRSRVSLFDLSVDSISTDPEDLASFTFSGTVDSSAKIAGKGAVNLLEPERHLDLDMSFSGYDLTATSPYWVTYLGRELAKGQFEIASRYEVRNNQLKGTNDFKIDQLTLGQKVESAQAISLPLGFAIKLMQDPSGMIAYEGLPVAGDLSDPKVKPWGLIGRAVRNLMLNAVASPFKFLAKMAGGREDLDSVRFAVAQVELDADALEKVAAIQKIMSSRPGLSVELAFSPDPAERAFLEEQHAKRLLANPDFKVVGGLDLLRPIDAELLEAAVSSEYAKWVEAKAEAVAEPVLDPNPSAEVSVEKPAKKPTGVVGKLANAIGLGRKGGDSEEATVADTKQEVRKATAESAASAEELPSFDEMLRVVLSSRPSVTLDGAWLDDISKERIQKFKSALLAGGAIANNRVFSAELSAEDSANAPGSILIQLSE